MLNFAPWHTFRPFGRMLGARTWDPYCPWPFQDIWEETVCCEVKSWALGQKYLGSNPGTRFPPLLAGKEFSVVLTMRDPWHPWRLAGTGHSKSRDVSTCQARSCARVLSYTRMTESQARTQEMRVL